LGLAVDVIGPAGFDLSDRALRRAGMDYLEMAALTRHDDWAAFDAWRRRERRRMARRATRATDDSGGVAYRRDDVLLVGRDTSGVPAPVAEAADAQLKIPLVEGARSLNLAVAVGMAAAMATDRLSRPQ